MQKSTKKFIETFRLTKKSKSELEYLCKKYGETKADLIRRLITLEFERERVREEKSES